MKLSVTVVVPAWNEGDFIAQTLQHLVEQTCLAKIIVVDDCSTDNTAAIAKSFSGVQVISLTKKAGSKSQALNAVVPQIKTDLFVCVDADTMLEKDALANLVDTFDNPSVMIACGHVCTTSRNNFWQGARNADYVVGQRVWKSAQSKIGAVLVMSGCLFAIRTEYLKRYGFDARTMAEDMDLTWRAIEDGHKVSYVPDAVCYVHDPNSWHLYKSQMLRWFRGYFQNLKVRNWKLPLYFGCVVYFYLAASLLSLPLAVMGMIWIVQDKTTIYAFFTWMLIIWVYCVYRERKNPLGLAIDMARYTLVAYVNWGLYLYSFWKEILTKDKLDVWVKGH